MYLAKIRTNYIDKRKKLPISIYGSFLAGEKASLTAVYEDISVSVEGNVVDVAQNRPMSEEDVTKQLLKIGNTCFVCEMPYIEVGEGVFVPNKALNELRRMLLQRLEDSIIHENGFDIERIDEKAPREEQECEFSAVTDANRSFAISISQKEQLYVIEKEDYAFDRLYLDYQLLLELDSVIIENLSKRWNLGVIYPRIVRKNAFDVLEKIYQKSSKINIALIKNLETLQFLKDKNFKGEMISDYTLYICNSKSAEWAKKEVQGICYPVELNKGELSKLNISNDLRKEQLVYSYLPLMVTANCLKKTSDRCGQKNVFEKVYDRYNKVFLSKSNCMLCYSEIFNCVPLSLHKYLKDMRYPVNAYRIDFTLEDSKMTKIVMDLYFKSGKDCDLGEYTTGHFKRGVE